MPGELNAAKRQQRHEASHVQAVRGWIEADVDRPRAAGQVGAEFRWRGDVREKPALLEILKNLRVNALGLDAALSHGGLSARPTAPV